LTTRSLNYTKNRPIYSIAASIVEGNWYTKTMSKTEDCPFCNFDQKVLKSNAHASVILSDPRKVPGHTLVIPKRHVEKPWELTPEELQGVFELIFFVEQKLIEHGLGDGVDIRQNYRPFLGQNGLKVDHIHFHVLPRASEDYIYQVSEHYDSDLFADLDAKEATEVAKLLK